MGTTIHEWPMCLTTVGLRIQMPLYLVSGLPFAQIQLDPTKAINVWLLATWIDWPAIGKMLLTGFLDQMSCMYLMKRSMHTGCSCKCICHSPHTCMNDLITCTEKACLGMVHSYSTLSCNLHSLTCCFLTSRLRSAHDVQPHFCLRAIMVQTSHSTSWA